MENDEIFECLIEPEQDGQRLDKVLAELAPEFSRARWQTVIKAGQVLVNGLPAKAKQPLFAGDRLSAPWPEEENLSDTPEPLALDLIYEDEAIAVINKPAGLVVHPAAGNRRGTLMNGLLYHFPNSASLARAGLVHRLDKDTSGLLVVAKTAAAQMHLQRQLQERAMGRSYLALVYRYVSAGGTIDLPLGRHPRDRLKIAVRSDGREAITHYRLEERFGETATLLRVNLETGRTHQIRVHLAEQKFPIVGDPLYGRPLLNKGNQPAVREALLHFPRQALHAEQLHLIHPLREEEMSFRAPLPADFAALLALLRQHLS